MYHILFCDVALHIAVGKVLLEDLRKGGILRVCVHDNNTLMGMAEFCKSQTIGLPRSDLKDN